MEGYLILIGFGVVFITLSVVMAKKYPVQGVEDFLVAGRKIPFGIISASIMVAWIWSITLMGAAEAVVWYGIGGAFAYAFGSFVPFLILVPIVLRMRKVMPHGTTFLEFVEQRFGRGMQKILFVFAILVALYLSVSQMMGIAYFISVNYQISYSMVVILVTIIITLYIAIAGFRGSIINDVIQFFFISVGVFIFITILLVKFTPAAIYEGFKDAVVNEQNANYNPDGLNLFAPGAVRYFIICLVICLGYVLFDQGYYSKALATINSKALLIAYLLGTLVAWAPIPIIVGNVLGGIGVATELAVGGGQITVSSEIAPYIFGQAFPGFGILLFGIVVFMAGMTTAGNALVGLQAILVVDFQEKFLKKKSTEIERAKYSQRATLVFGLIVMIIALSLKGVSILYLDIMTGIVFAAPVAAFVAGMFSNRITPKVAILSVILGVIGGVTSYILVKDPDIDYFVGNVVSLVVPIVVVFLGSLFSKERFDFGKLEEYRPAHKIASEE